MFDWIALDLFPLHKLEGASKLFMTIKTDWWITSATRKNDVAVHGQLRAEVCMNVPALKPFPTWIALNCLCRSTCHFTSITCGIISFDHQGQCYYTMPGLGMNFLFFFLSTPEQRTIFTVKKKTGHNVCLVKSWIPSSFVWEMQNSWPYSGHRPCP